MKMTGTSVRGVRNGAVCRSQVRNVSRATTVWLPPLFAGTTSVTVNYTNTIPTTNYVLSYNTNLATANWYTAGTKAAVGTADSQTDSPPAGSPRRYYRVYYVK